MDRLELSQLVEGLVATAEQILQAKRKAQESKVYSEFGYRIRPEGIEFFDKEEDAYDQGSYHAISDVITWAQIEWADDTIKGYEAVYAAIAEESNRKQRDWERLQYERLKAKFER